MPMNQIDPGHNTTRDTFRVMGPVVALTGVGFMIVAFVNFFHAFGGHGQPELFWCFFIGVPLLFAGGVMTSYGYMGKVMRYTAQEMAPVGKDTFNYMADGTREGVKTIASAIGQGLHEGGLGAAPTMIRCLKCNAPSPADAKFCSQCGHALSKTRPCPNCRELNDPDAKFCDNCGRAFETGA
jgi:hypothetical protein